MVDNGQKSGCAVKASLHVGNIAVTDPNLNSNKFQITLNRSIISSSIVQYIPSSISRASAISFPVT